MSTKPRNDITVEYIQERLDYDLDKGKLYWKPTSNKSWSTKFAGKEAGCRFNGGYIKLSIDNEGYLAHRLLWVLAHGYWPDGIDHINGIRSDNRIVNLREANQSQNMSNVARWAHNTSGVKNVRWHEATGKWLVRVKKRGYTHYFGYYEDLEEACEVAHKARIELHGAYSNHGKTQL